MSTTTDTKPTAKAGGSRPQPSAGPARILASIGGQNLSLIGALIVVLALFGVLNDNFLSLGNMQVIAEAATITGLLAIVQTVVI
ncbi:ABC transporter permease, partial [Streptomyces sp. BE303]|nr:ABC transporter permease [Streptomyces sp. BE303]